MFLNQLRSINFCLCLTFGWCLKRKLLPGSCGNFWLLILFGWLFLVGFFANIVEIVEMLRAVLPTLSRVGALKNFLQPAAPSDIVQKLPPSHIHTEHSGMTFSKPFFKPNHPANTLFCALVHWLGFHSVLNADFVSPQVSAGYYRMCNYCLKICQSAVFRSIFEKPGPNGPEITKVVIERMSDLYDFSTYE